MTIQKRGKNRRNPGKRIFVILLTMMMVITACPDVFFQTASAKELGASIQVASLPANVLVVKKGKTYRLKATVKTEENISKEVTYRSANDTVASVSAKGVVKGVRCGSTKITIQSKENAGIKKVIKVKVGTPVKKIKAASKVVSMTRGRTYQIKAKIFPKKATYKKLSYTSSDREVARVSKKGKVTALKEGKAVITITAKDGSKKKTRLVVTVRGTGSSETQMEDPANAQSVSDNTTVSSNTTADQTENPAEDPTEDIPGSKPGEGAGSKEQPGGSAAETIPGTKTEQQPGGGEAVEEKPGEGTGEQPGSGEAVEEKHGEGTGEQPGGEAVEEKPGEGTGEQPGSGTQEPPVEEPEPEYPTLRFDLGAKKGVEGYICVSATEKYDAEKGYGFYQTHLAQDVDSDGEGPLADAVHFVGGNGHFMVDLEPGVYRITVTIGNVVKTTIKAEETKQLLFLKGTHTKDSFTIPVTDGCLDIYAESGVGSEFSISSLEIAQISTETTTNPTIWILGDENTAKVYGEPSNDIRGWGEYLPAYVDRSKYEIRNLAVGSFKSGEIKGYALPTLERYGKTGDILLLQSGYVDKDAATFKENITEIVQRAKAKGVQVYLVKMFCTRPDVNKYPRVTNVYLNTQLEEVAAEQQVGLIDLYQDWYRLILVNYYYERKQYYAFDNTHLSELGAKKFAEMVSDSLFKEPEPVDYGDDPYDFDAAGTTVYESVVSKGPISNPHKGFVMTSYKPHMIDSTLGYEYGIGGPLHNRAWDCSTIVCGEPKWCDLNPAKGVYDWSYIDNMLEKCEEYGLTYGIRFLPYSSWNGADYVPQWVYDEGAKTQIVRRKDREEEEYIEFPVWDHPVYLQAIKDFATALAEHVDGDPRVEFVDVSVFGDYGEWHNSYVEGDYMPSLEIQKDMLDHYASVFKKTLVAVPSGAKGEIYQYALSIGIARRDNGLISTPNVEWSLIPTYEANLPVIGENFWPYSMMLNMRPERADEYDYVNWSPERFEETIEIAHLSIYAFDQDSHSSYEFYLENKDIIDKMCNRLGYNYTVTSAERLGNRLAITVKNTGVAPSYFDIQLSAEITDANGNKIENFGQPVLIEKGTFRSETQKTFVFDYEGDLPADATICLAMYDINNPLVAGKDPTVRFDNKNNLANKRLKLVQK